MPCDCSNIRAGQCNCKIVNNDVFLHKNSINRSTGMLVGQELLDPNIHRIHSMTFVKNNFMIQTLERIYEICATFNIRYCPFRGSLRNKHCVIHALKDFAILLCFFAANFVVFLMIVTRMTLHITYIFLEGLRWAQRCLTPNLSETRLAILSKPPWHQAHLFNQAMDKKTS